MTLIAPTAKKKWVFSSSQEKFKTMPMHNLVRGREGGGGGAWVQTRSIMGKMHKHIFPSTLSTDKGSEDSFKV